MPVDIVQAKLKEIKKRYNINNVFFSTKWYGDSYYYSGKYVLFNIQHINPDIETYKEIYINDIVGDNRDKAIATFIHKFVKNNDGFVVVLIFDVIMEKAFDHINTFPAEYLEMSINYVLHKITIDDIKV
jgi:hypothetical protein